MGCKGLPWRRRSVRSPRGAQESRKACAPMHGPGQQDGPAAPGCTDPHRPKPRGCRSKIESPTLRREGKVHPLLRPLSSPQHSLRGLDFDRHSAISAPAGPTPPPGPGAPHSDVTSGGCLASLPLAPTRSMGGACAGGAGPGCDAEERSLCTRVWTLRFLVLTRTGASAASKHPCRMGALVRCDGIYT